MTSYRLDAAPLFLTVPELAAALRISEKTVHGWTRRHGPDSIPRIKLGRGYAFDLGDVVRWLKEYRDPRLDAPALRGPSPSSGPSRRVLGRRRRRAPKGALGGRPSRNPGTTRVSANGPAGVAAPLPPGEAEPTGEGHAR